MNGYSLWKWIAGELGEIPLEFCGDSEEALSVQAQFDERKESLVDRVQRAVFTLVRTKTTDKTGLLIARRSALETERLKDLVRLLTYTKPLANDGLFTH